MLAAMPTVLIIDDNAAVAMALEVGRLGHGLLRERVQPAVAHVATALAQRVGNNLGHEMFAIQILEVASIHPDQPGVGSMGNTMNVSGIQH